MTRIDSNSYDYKVHEARAQRKLTVVRQESINQLGLQKLPTFKMQDLKSRIFENEEITRSRAVIKSHQASKEVSRH